MITFELDFGEIYHPSARGRVGITVLRLAHQSAASVNRALGRYFADPASAAIPFERSLVVIDDARVRVTTEPEVVET